MRLLAPARSAQANLVQGRAIDVADKLTQTILDGLTRAAAEPAGLPLFVSRSELGLFPTGAAFKNAAQKCVAEGMLTLARTEPRGKTACEIYTLSDAGWEFLLAQVNPKQVLEDFVRVLESRQGEVDGLLAVATRMADSLEGLKDAVARVLPQIATGKLPGLRGEVPVLPPEPSSFADTETRLTPSTNGTHHLNGVATLEPATRVSLTMELAGAIVSRLTDWAASAGACEDCPLPELYRSLSTREPSPTVGEFHDCLRELQQTGKVYLHPWTGPLYALPEPTFALLVGHNIAYYASVRQG